jgi:hypothetical protein
MSATVPNSVAEDSYDCLNRLKTKVTSPFILTRMRLSGTGDASTGHSFQKVYRAQKGGEGAIAGRKVGNGREGAPADGGEGAA